MVYKNNTKDLNQGGFTLIEILVVITLIGIVSAAILPRMFRHNQTKSLVHFVADLNNIVVFARQEAITTHSAYRLQFSLHQKNPPTIQVQKENIDIAHNKKTYTLATSYYFQTLYQLPPEIKIKAFYHGKKNMLLEDENVAYCYISLLGMPQDIIIHFERTIATLKSQYSVRLNPFLGTFDCMDGFIKPDMW